ncbi:SMI1/KNR4 family protein [Streptomyces sp. KS 21]|uniref:SMI1/KNR4 family protein n=1 Tax=Streptomyces sp. KS 21 TaxID=2485150 RepID=UPI0010641AE4|nr:SMI1/KNR4 family protein [Streptomyces sp. KS 21]TDU67040.1 SUKH superfamily protein [Streptomyces sp. KS 21]TDU67990.1 SUKH superfamily protein [Streptomyces sp. KS 21]
MVIAALSQVLPTDCGVDEHVDWAAAEAKWGSGFPADFVAFMSAYGAGSLTRDIGILQPLSSDFEEETETARYTWEMEGGREALDVDPSHILAWGATGGGDILGWLTTHADPDAWPVLVWERGSAEFRIHGCGMTEFLRKLLLDEFPTYPISLDLRSADWRFVHWSVARDRRCAGLDTYTGLPR